MSKFRGIFDARRAQDTEDAQQPPKRGRGRPKGSAGGKRDDEHYTQASAYILRKTHKKVKAALIEDEKEFSELIEELLTEWLEARKSRK